MVKICSSKMTARIIIHLKKDLLKTELFVEGNRKKRRRRIEQILQEINWLLSSLPHSLKSMSLYRNISSHQEPEIHNQRLIITFLMFLLSPKLQSLLLSNYQSSYYTTILLQISFVKQKANFNRIWMWEIQGPIIYCFFNILCHVGTSIVKKYNIAILTKFILPQNWIQILFHSIQ